MVCVYGIWEYVPLSGAEPGFRRAGGGGGGVENRSYPDVHDFSLRMQVIIYC